MIRRVFTPTAIESIRELAGQGRSASEIADTIGSTAASVRVKCCQLKIKLSRRARPNLLQTSGHRLGAEKLVVFMRPADYCALKRKAAGMQKSAGELAEMLLQAIASSDIYEAVLGNDKHIGAVAALPRNRA